jgi:hypothetical protein
MEHDQPPILIKADEALNLAMASFHAGKSSRTIRDWCSRYGIGCAPSKSGTLRISAPALEMVLHGDMAALDLLRDGKRDDERVRRYFDHLGLLP